MMPFTDSMFLLVETREHPMHVAGLQLFEMPHGAGQDYLREVYQDLVGNADVHELFGRAPRTGLSNLGPWSWRDDDDIDLEYHVRLSALPRPGRVRELFEMVSRWHGTLLDRHRPLWEMHLIEGLEGHRFAIYTKVHHSLLDGVAALRWLRRTLSPDPEERGLPAPFNVPVRPKRLSERRLTSFDIPTLLGRARYLAGDAAGFPGVLTEMARKGLRDHELALPFQAPKTMFNTGITGARRFAAQAWEMERINTVRKATACTLNDVVLAMCAGALRKYLIEMHALPDASLVAAVPVSLRSKPGQAEDASVVDESPEAGNSIGFVLCDLATDRADPEDRLARIMRSIRGSKATLEGRSPLQVLALSALTIAPLGLSPVPGFVDQTRPPFNVIISNVPGPTRPLYWNGARMQGVYPMSIVLDGQALNITVTSYAGALQFGLTGCRRTVPHLQRILGELDESLGELERL